MLLSLNWLREFVPYTGSPEELGARLTMLGLELDGVSHPFPAIEGMVVGRIEECKKHPDSDHLILCRVNLGSEIVDIICGAPNTAPGQHVVVAPVGSTMPDGTKVKKAKLRGQESNGIICSERELGLSDDHRGILVLDEEMSGPFTLGQNAREAMGLDTAVLDISVTPNRGDCLSVLGLARETALAFNLPLTLPAIDYAGVERGSCALEGLQLEVESGDVSSYYHLRAIEGLKVGRSPAWLRWRLQGVGQRSISNLVDVTNYVMLELGQPLHSFDLHKVRGGKVRVALAGEGEKLVTLDGQERQLVTRDITIRDAEGPIGLGGVMGGANSDIDAQSSAVLLEGAIFNPSLIRRTSKRLHLSSEASYRFERGVDQSMCGYALERAAAMIAKLGQGKLSAGSLGSEPKPWVAPLLPLRRERAELLIGVSLTPEFCEDCLSKLGCKLEKDCTEAGRETWRVAPPNHRPDLEREVDLIEELARVYGFDNLPQTLPEVERPAEKAGEAKSIYQFVSRVKHWAAGLGLNEVVNYSFVGHKDLDLFGLPAEGRLSIMNPLTSDMDVLRTALLPGLMNSLRNNLAQGAGGLRVFEVANAFTADPASETTAHENLRLGLLFYGDRFSAGWPQTQAEADYLDVKGVVEALLDKLRLPAAVYANMAVDSGKALPWLLPGVSVSLVINGQSVQLGWIGRVKPEIADVYHARKNVWAAELDMDLLYKLSLGVKPRSKPLPVFPPVRRDITVIAPLGLEAEAVLAVIKKSSPAGLESVSLVDLFLPAGGQERNLTFRLTYRAADRTLQDAEVDKLRDSMAAALVKALPVRI
ncbi:MAG: phenylalanine--tRNA ligase subunit beta [Deltaproteobacteria bacterium]|jgi:phenylalanyl-tRNA synthetase beta chain|nr:phenylalanine--tRNA ligase subunit beta [Deltaproteobacteria bacterium]